MSADEDRLFPMYRPEDNQEPHEDAQTRPHVDFNKIFEEELKKSDPLKTPSGHVYMFFKVLSPIILAFYFFYARGNTMRELCRGPSYTWAMVAGLYYLTSGFIEIRNAVVEFAQGRKWNVDWVRRGDHIISIVNIILYPVSFVVNIVLFTALLWSDDCPDMVGALWFWFIVQFLSWVSCVFCCCQGGASGISTFKKFDLNANARKFNQNQQGEGEEGKNDEQEAEGRDKTEEEAEREKKEN